MKKIIGLAIAFCSLYTAAFAKQTEVETIELAAELGSILAAEEFCGFEYIPDAIDVYLENFVDADNKKFNDHLYIKTEIKEMSFEHYSKNQKRAYCAQTKRVAKSFNFIK